MDILLVTPPYYSLMGESSDFGYQVGITSLAAYLRQGGLDTAVLTGDLLLQSPSNTRGWNYDIKKYAAKHQDYERIVNDKDHLIWKKLADIVRQTEPMAVGISYLTPLKCVVEKIARLIREIDPDIKIVAGSFHPTFRPEEVMRNSDIDFAVTGEGEIPLLSLVRGLKQNRPKLDTVPGIYYRDTDGQIQNNPGVNPVANLDELPFLARDLVLGCDYNSYRGHSMSTTRGCPYTCSFCADRNFWNGKVRRRSVDNVMAEMRHLKNTYRVDFLDFVDGTFTYDRNYLQTFCHALIDNKLDINWRCTARYDNLNEELLRLMKQAGCSGILFGLESGSDRILKAVDKKMTAGKLVQTSKMVRRSGIPSVGTLMVGLPDERQEDMEQTLRFMRKIQVDLIDVNTYVPLPGTALYDSMSEEDKISLDWSKVAYKSIGINFSKSIPPDAFIKYQYQAFKIANSIRRKSLFRIGARLFFSSVARKLKISGKRADSSPFS